MRQEEHFKSFAFNLKRPTSDGIRKERNIDMSKLNTLKLPQKCLKSRKDLKAKVNKIIDDILIYEMTDAEVSVWNSTDRLNYHIHRMFSSVK